MSDRWVDALYAYRNRPFAIMSVLPLMALAHIEDDLPTALFHKDVTKTEFDEVEEIILGCLKDVLDSISKDGSAGVKFFSMTMPIWSPFGQFTIHALRERAWEKFKKRKRLQEHDGR